MISNEYQRPMHFNEWISTIGIITSDREDIKWLNTNSAVAIKKLLEGFK